jgi:hyaluronate lyase
MDATALVGHWKLDEGEGLVARDVSGNGHTGSIWYAAWREVEGRRGLHFDGVSSRVVIPHAADLALTGDISICAWIRKQRSNEGQRWDCVLAKNPGSWDYDLLTSKARSNQLAFYSSATQPQEVYSGQTLQWGMWQHVAASRCGDEVTCFIDGVATSISKMPGALPSSDGDLIIGHDGAPGRGFGMHGMISDVWLFSRALAGEEIAGIASGALS